VMRARHQSTLRGVIICCLLALAGSVPRARSDLLGSQIRLSEFRTRETADDGATEWELSGVEAVIQGGIVEMKNVKLRLYLDDGSEALVTSPRSVFDRDAKMISSASAISIDSAAFELEGTGYDIPIEQERVHIRSKVHMKVRSATTRGLVPGASAGDAGTEGNQTP